MPDVWDGSDMDGDGMDYHQPGQMFSGGLEIPSDNDVSCMVEEYLTEDTTTLADEDWATFMDEAAFMINNPAHHVSMSVPMNSSPRMDLNFGGMYSGSSSENLQINSLSSQTNHYHGHQQSALQTLHNNQLQQPSQQNQHQQMPLNNYDCYQHDQTSSSMYHQPQPPHELTTRVSSSGLQYLNAAPFSVNSPHHQYSHISQTSQQANNNVAYYDSPAMQNSNSHFSQTSPVYYVAQTVGKIPAPDNGAPTNFNFEQYASVPVLNTSGGMHLIRSNGGSRNHSSSSAGNSPSSQSPVSEEDYPETVSVSVKVAASRRKSETPAVKKPKAAAKQRRRKKDPNEPTKPVSAYALFFRDKQANIKGSKPDATFGEVSKIVAQMWDNLDPEKKAMYKKRTEEAKKEYLQQLAVYRASLLTPEPPMYIQTNFVARSSPMQMTNYNRPVYNTTSANNGLMHSTGNGHAIKTHLTFPQNHLPARTSPVHLGQDDCLQLNSQSMGNEGQIKMENTYGQVYRVLEPTGKNDDYIASLWNAQVVGEGDGLVAHCKDEYSWTTSQRPNHPAATKVVI